MYVERRYFKHLQDKLLSIQEKKSLSSQDKKSTALQRATDEVKSAITYPSNNKLIYTNQLPPVRDQGVFGSCWGHGAACCKEYQETIELGLTQPISFSPQYVYDLREDWTESGMSGKEVMKALHKFGICEEIHWPYRGNAPDWSKLLEKQMITGLSQEDKKKYVESIELIRTKIPSEIKEISRNYKINKLYFQADSVKEILHALVNYGPCTISMETFHYGIDSSEPSAHDRIWEAISPDWEKPKARHTMTVVGFNNFSEDQNGLSGNLIIRNSWSNQWGVPIDSSEGGYVELPFSEYSDSNMDVWVLSDAENPIPIAPEGEGSPLDPYLGDAKFDFYFDILKHFSQELAEETNPIPANPTEGMVYLLGIRGWKEGRLYPEDVGEENDSIIALWLSGNVKHCADFTAKTTPDKKKVRSKKGSPILSEGVHSYSFDAKTVSWATPNFSTPSVSTGNPNKFNLIPAKSVEYQLQLTDGEKSNESQKGKLIQFKSSNKKQSGDQVIDTSMYHEFVSILTDNHTSSFEVEIKAIPVAYEKALKKSNYDPDSPPSSINIPENITYTLVSNEDVGEYLEGGDN